MFYVYVIKNGKGDLYKGHTENLQRRILEHNNGKTKSLRKAKDWQLQYKEEFETREEAIQREKYFKTAAGRKFLKQKLTL